MEKMEYAEELVREFLVFRGFTNTLQSYDSELRSDIGQSFQLDKILDLIFSLYIPKFQSHNLIALLGFFNNYLSETTLVSTFSKLETSLLRFYVVHALQSNRADKVFEFFETYGSELLQKSQDWTHWFAIPHMKNPNLDPEFKIFFTKEWYEALRLSVRNFFSEIFNATRLPALLKISSEMNVTNLLKRDVMHLNLKLSKLQALLAEKEAQLCHFSSMEGTSSSSNLREDSTHMSKDSPEVFPIVLPRVGQSEISQLVDGPENIKSQSISSKSGHDSTSLLNDHLRNGETGDPTQKGHDSSIIENSEEEDFPEVKVEHQETFLGHTSPITRCRFSVSGNNIASASLDGTVRIWTYDTSTPVSRNATIYCGTEILSLDWECKSDRLLLIGTSDGCIKAWNVDAKRVVCDLSTTEAFPSVLDIKCSPVEPIFVSAAASGGVGSNYSDNLGFASLTVWNMKTWKAMTVLPLGEDPPAITSLCFNHNGKILAASAIDGMIHMFDMSAGLQITGWPAHDSSISSILFGPDETSLFSLGSDGKIFEWSLQNPGQILWSRDCSRFCYPLKDSKYCRHEMALDANGRRLLVTSSSVRAPIYQVQGQLSGWRTLAHGAPITAVDWHPTLPIFLTGSADNSVRVTSLSS
ncbi:hypothetical protein TanjilG_04704 [Lupinus angustifolius]|uniref:Uncharacterized protein n=1 Tax=Lupinus angustifolius TaxID=3871 RepID=A0A4P1RJZ5_LUPAN|nr:PREDICTED: WD repeat-containing protein 91 homolog isoform X1 [Lupinus angustifolius]OIW12540.1 hypothetical protein TanjilG_04704 [Lupinus angustifolius]